MDRNEVWKPPEEGWLKVNIDGSFNNGVGASGGLIRDVNGVFKVGFLFKGIFTTSLRAELWGVMLGLRLAWENNISHLVLETDATEVTRLIGLANFEEHNDKDVIMEIQNMLARDWDVRVVHISRSANKAADLMTKAALTNFPGYLPMFHPSDELEGVLMQDLLAYKSCS